MVTRAHIAVSEKRFHRLGARGRVAAIGLGRPAAWPSIHSATLHRSTAARRIGRELAKVRKGEAEPTPSAYREAVRDVMRTCIYAVDKNPLAASRKWPEPEAGSQTLRPSGAASFSSRVAAAASRSSTTGTSALSMSSRTSSGGV